MTLAAGYIGTKDAADLPLLLALVSALVLVVAWAHRQPAPRPPYRAAAGFGLRLSLGAGRMRMVRQLRESSVLALLGGGKGSSVRLN